MNKADRPTNSKSYKRRRRERGQKQQQPSVHDKIHTPSPRRCRLLRLQVDTTQRRYFNVSAHRHRGASTRLCHHRAVRTSGSLSISNSNLVQRTLASCTGDPTRLMTDSILLRRRDLFDEHGIVRVGVRTASGCNSAPLDHRTSFADTRSVACTEPVLPRLSGQIHFITCNSELLERVLPNGAFSPKVQRAFTIRHTVALPVPVQQHPRV